MKALDKRYKALLKKIALQLQSDIKSKVRDTRLKCPEPLIKTSDTFGFFVTIFQLKKIPGEVELWLDLFPNTGRPILSLCYDNGDIERIKKLAHFSTVYSRNIPDLDTNKIIKTRAGSYMEKPLPLKLFDTFITESFRSKFFTMYFRDEIKLRDSSRPQFITKASKKTEWLIRAIGAALDNSTQTSDDYPLVENKQLIQKHIRRERKSRLATQAKLRDGYTCRVCDFNFTDMYGDYGRSFAEAHHKIALSKHKGTVTNRAEDLITVCANCHRMLHKMRGNENDYKELRKLITKGKTKT